MSCETDTLQALKDAGHKLTPQRLMIVAALRHAGEHLTAQDVHQRVRQEYPYVDLSTVYRTLAVLREMHLVTETDMGTGDHSYEWIESDRHHHLICRTCGSTASLPHPYLENLGAEVLDERGFRMDLDHVALFGICAACLASKPATSRGGVPS
jgi:Fur family ferric uptake transcriptional regulator